MILGAGLIRISLSCFKSDGQWQEALVVTYEYKPNGWALTKQTAEAEPIIIHDGHHGTKLSISTTAVFLISNASRSSQSL